MAQVRAILAGRWMGTGVAGNAFRPRLNTDFALDSYNDLTGQDSGVIPPSPNVYIIDAFMDSTVLTAIQAAAGVLVLWDDSIDIDTNLTAAQRNAVLNRLQNMGYDLTTISNYVQLPITRREAIRLMVLLMRQAQKA